MNDWRSRLSDLLDEAVAVEGVEAVGSRLHDEIERIRPSTPATLVVEVPVLGVVASAEGWVAVLLAPGRPAAVLAGASVAALVELARESLDLAVVALGLPGPTPEAQAWVRSRPTVAVIDVRPALSFARMAGASIAAAGDDADGVQARRAALEAVGLVAPAWYRGSGFGEGDLLDACAAAWSAVRYAAGDGEPLADADPAAIWV